MQRNQLIRVMAVSVILIVCAINVQAKKVTGSGNVVKDSRLIENVMSIDCSGTIDVFLSQGEKESLVVEADDNLIEYIITEVKNGTLNIKNQDGIRFVKPEKLNIYITIKDIHTIKFNGVGDLKCQTELSLSKLTVSNNGVGDINLKGNVIELDIRNHGVGDINAFGFVAKNATIHNSGVGDIEVNATENLNVENNGVGDINYSGGAKFIDIESNGVGSIRKR